MLPLLPFLAGIVVGSLSVSAARRSRVGATLHHARDTLREAAHTSQAFTQRFTQRVWPSAPAAAVPTEPVASVHSVEPAPPATAPAAPVAAFAEAVAAPASASAPTSAKPRKRTSKKATSHAPIPSAVSTTSSTAS